jgi:hypothetical protein
MEVGSSSHPSEETPTDEAIRRSRGKAEPVVLFVVLALILSWIPALIFVSRCGCKPIPVSEIHRSWVFWAVSAGPLLATGLARLISRDRSPLGVRPSVPPAWTALSIILPILWTSAIVTLAVLTRLADWPYPEETILHAFGSAMVAGLGIGLPLGLIQEIGWRGLLLPGLLDRGRIGASLLVGVIWAASSAPLVLLTGSYGGASLPLALAAHLLHVFLLSLLMTWIYLGSGRSLTACVLAHAMLWTFAGAMTQPGRLDGMPILAGARGILGSMFLVLWAWWLYLRGSFGTARE